MKRNAEKTLPDWPSYLIELAIDDILSIDRSKMRPFWGVWYKNPHNSAQCQICLAGAVMAGTLGVAKPSRGREIRPEHLMFDVETERKLNLIESARAQRWSLVLDKALSFPTYARNAATMKLASDCKKELRKLEIDDTHEYFTNMDACIAYTKELGKAVNVLRKYGF